MEVIVYGDPLILARMRFCHMVDEGLIFLSRKVITGEKIEHHFNLDDWIRARGFNQPVKNIIISNTFQPRPQKNSPMVTEIPPSLVGEVFDGAESDDFPWRPCIFGIPSSFGQVGSCCGNVGFFVSRVAICLGHVEAIDEVTHLRRFQNQGRQESLHFFAFTQRLLVIKSLGCHGWNSDEIRV